MPERSDPAVTAEALRQVARITELALDDERAQAILPMVRDYLEDANRVNRFMEAHRDLDPLVRILAPHDLDGVD
jgi:hypothetical protein